MKTLVIILLLVFATVTQAQTPTPHPNALGIGMYEFVDLSSPELELTGSGWSTRASEGETGVGTDVVGDTMTFHVDDNASHLIIYRSMSGGSWEICIDALCQVITNVGMGWLPLALPLAQTNSEVVITHLNDNETIFLKLVISQSQDVGMGTPFPISGTGSSIIYIPLIFTPDAPDYVDYAEATDEVGNPTYTRIENVVSPGDQFNVSGLSMIIILLFAILVVTLWQQ